MPPTSPSREPARRGMFWPLGSARPSAGRGGTSVLAVADLRAANAAGVLAAVRSAASPQRHSELAAATQLSRPTVEAIVDELVQAGLLTDATGSARPRGGVPGRPARLFEFDPRAAFVVGVDVRAYAVNVCVADLNGDMVAVERRKARRDLTGPARARLVESLVAEVVGRAVPEGRTVCAATVGTPGWVEDNRRVRYVDNLKDWADVDIAESLATLLRAPVAVDNDANLAAVGEQWRGSGRGTTDLMFVLAGERIGAGIISGGRPVHGHHGAAGEIGFMVFPEGNRLAARAIGSPGSERPGIDPRSVYADRDVVRDAVAGKRRAVAALESVGRRLAQALAPVLLALDPEVVVLGTSLFEEADVAGTRLVLEGAQRHAAELLVDPPRWDVSSLGDDAVLVGATRFALAAVENVLQHRPLSLFG